MTPDVFARELGKLVDTARQESQVDAAAALDVLLGALDGVIASVMRANVFMEQRRAPRASLRIDVIDRAQPDRRYSTLDISIGGMRIRSPLALEEGAVIPLEFTIVRETIACAGEVMWCHQPHQVSTDYLVGLKLDLPMAGKRLVQDYVESALHARGG